MPELPEVERFRAVARRAGVGHRVVEVVACDDPLVFDGCDANTLSAAILDKTLRGVARHGKYLWWVIRGGPCVLFHFGMTGLLSSNREAPLALKTAPPSTSSPWPPARAVLRVRFSSGAELALSTTRRMSRVRVVDAPRAEAPVNRLGPDVLDALPPVSEFRVRLASSRGAIKSALLDQGRLAGLGNWMADEILFLAKVSPLRGARTLHDSEWGALRSAVAEVVQIAVDAGAESEQFPPQWLFHGRWDAARDPDALRQGLSFTTVAGRATVFDPRRQR